MKRGFLEEAAKALKNAYVLWGFPVGTAVLTENEEIYSGCNVESWVSGLGVCAERCAIHHAVLHERRTVKAVAVVVDAKNKSEIKPCGHVSNTFQTSLKTPKLKLSQQKLMVVRFSLKRLK